MIEQLRFLNPDTINEIAEHWGTPTYVYSEQILREQASRALSFAAPFGLTVRYAMKANPSRTILMIFKDMGINIDASSGPEIHRALNAGLEPEQILLTTQQLPDDFVQLAQRGVQFNASSLTQLEQLGRMLPGTSIGIRVNPGTGSGHSARVSTGGAASSFGIWHEYLPRAIATAKQHNLTITRLHTHIGSGTDPKEWERAAAMSLDIARQLPDVTTINLGGGFKVARVEGEVSTDIAKVSKTISTALQDFARTTNRQLHLEIEPGSYLVVTAGALVTTIHDVVDTGPEGYKFIKIDGGMTELIRPAMYGAQHALVVVNNRPEKIKDYVVVGRCCETGDVLTTAPYHPETLAPRQLQEAQVGDHLIIEGVGAYGSSFNVSGYNSFGLAPEVLLSEDGSLQQIRRRQTLNDLLLVEENRKDINRAPIGMTGALRRAGLKHLHDDQDYSNE